MLTRCDLASPQERARYVLEMHAVMAWPKDQARRRSFLCFVGAFLADVHGKAMEAAEAAGDETLAREEERWRDSWEHVYSDNGGRRGLMQAPAGDQLLDEYDRRVKDAFLAGRVLNFAIKLYKSDGSSGNASLRKAKEIVYKHVPRDVAAMLNLPRSHRPVDEAWASHRCVAHLAAAFMNHRGLALDAMVNGRGDGCTRFGLFLERQELIDLLRTAVTAQTIAADVIPDGQKAPILPASEIIGAFPGVTPFADDEVDFVPLAETVAFSLQKASRRRGAACPPGG